MNLYVGNLDFNTTREQLRAVFAGHGTVKNVSIVTDRLTDQYRSFGSVEMQNDGEAEEAVRTLNGKIVGGHRLAVHESRPKPYHSRDRNSEVRWWRRHV